MTFFALSALINMVASIFLGFFVYIQNRKQFTHKMFILFCLAVGVWSYAYFIWQISTTAKAALFWSHVLMAGAIFIPLFYLHFLFALREKIKEKKKLLVFGYISLSFFFLTNFSPWFIEGVRPKLGFAFWPDAGSLFHPFLAIWFFYVAYAIYFLIKECTKTPPIERKQIIYILVGTIIGYLGGATNYFLWYDIPIPPVGNWTAVFYIGIVAYAINRYHFMDIRVILTEFLVIVIGFVLLVETVISKSLSELLFRGSLFLFFCFIGYLLIKSVLNEIKLREKLEIANNAKSEFVSIASHQLRTPLTAVKGYISLMIEGTYGKLSPELQKPLRNVYESNEKLINLVNDLLDLSRLEAGKIEFSPTLTSLEKIVSSIVDDLKINSDKKGLYLKLIKPKKPLPEIMVDQPKARQVVLNIVDNAIKYTKDGGITIKLQETDSREQIIISDTGIGLTKDEIKNLFQMFSRGAAGAKLHTGGSGVGLHVAKKFIEMHQGRIWVESEGKNKGSTFYIELPLRRGASTELSRMSSGQAIK